MHFASRCRTWRQGSVVTFVSRVPDACSSLGRTHTLVTSDDLTEKQLGGVKSGEQRGHSTPTPLTISRSWKRTQGHKLVSVARWSGAPSCWSRCTGSVAGPSRDSNACADHSLNLPRLLRYRVAFTVAVRPWLFSRPIGHEMRCSLVVQQLMHCLMCSGLSPTSLASPVPQKRPF